MQELFNHYLKPFKVPSIEELKEARKKRLLINVLLIFGDESHDPKEKRTLVVSGLMGTQKEWDELTLPWTKCNEGKPFHATDCEAVPPRGVYEGMSPKKCKNIYAKVTKLLAETKMLGFSAILDLRAYKELLHDKARYIPHGHCFQALVIHFVERAYISIPQQKVKFTFDLNLETSGTYKGLYELMRRNKSDWNFAPFLDEISFVHRDDHIGIQAADLLARETMKYYDNFYLGLHQRPIRSSMELLKSTQRYTFMHFSKEWIENHKRQAPLIAREIGLKSDDYKRWLEKRGIKHDTSVNQYRFFIETRGDKD